MPVAAAAAAMLGNYGPVLTYTPAGTTAHPYMSAAAAGTILLAAAPPGSASTPLCTVLLVSNLNEEVRIMPFTESVTSSLI